VDNSGNMSTEARQIYIGHAVTASAPYGYFHSVGMWNDILSAAEMLALYNDGNGRDIMWDTNTGDYVSGADCDHWWRLGHATNWVSGIAQMGIDYGQATARYLDDNGNNQWEHFVTDSPRGY
jgi:hypothetical protein